MKRSGNLGTGWKERLEKKEDGKENWRSEKGWVGRLEKDEKEE